MTEIHGAPSSADDSLVIRCSCVSGCIVGFQRWDDMDAEHRSEFYAEFYSGFCPHGLWHRLKAAWTCLRGREHVVDGVVLTEDAARRIGEFFGSVPPPRKEQD